MSAFPRSESKFALLALASVRTDMPNVGAVLPDATHVLTRLPIELDGQWQNWLGVESSHVSSANLVLALVLRMTQCGDVPNQGDTVGQ